MAFQGYIVSPLWYDVFKSVVAPKILRVCLLQGFSMSETAIRLHIEPLEEGGYVATSEDVPGLVVEGQSLVEVADLARSLTQSIVETYLDHGDPLPPALDRVGIVGPIDLMIPVEIH